MDELKLPGLDDEAIVTVVIHDSKVNLKVQKRELRMDSQGRAFRWYIVKDVVSGTPLFGFRDSGTSVSIYRYFKRLNYTTRDTLVATSKPTLEEAFAHALAKWTSVMYVPDRRGGSVCVLLTKFGAGLHPSIARPPVAKKKRRRK